MMSAASGTASAEFRCFRRCHASMSVFGKSVLTDSSCLHICRFTGRGDVIVASLVANMTDSLFPDLKSGG